MLFKMVIMIIPCSLLSHRSCSLCNATMMESLNGIIYGKLIACVLKTSELLASFLGEVAAVIHNFTHFKISANFWILVSNKTLMNSTGSVQSHRFSLSLAFCREMNKVILLRYSVSIKQLIRTVFHTLLLLERLLFASSCIVALKVFHKMYAHDEYDELKYLESKLRTLNVPRWRNGL